MDSLTHIALGATVGHLLSGKELGRKALLWGAVAGTIPDLDVIPAAYMDPAARMLFHRGPSHSLLILLMLALFFGWLSFRLDRKKSLDFKRWSIFWFAGMFTHVLLDLFTTYGTEFFYPFSQVRIAWGSISVVDPVFTLPLLLILIALLIRNTLKKAVWWALGISLIYLGATVINKEIMTGYFQKELSEQKIPYQRLKVLPTFFNNILWRVVAEGKDYFFTGDHSYFDQAPATFKKVAKHWALTGKLDQEKQFMDLVRASEGFYRLEKSGNKIFYEDLRFGGIRFSKKQEGSVFRYALFYNGSGELVIERNRPPLKERFAGLFSQLMKRVLGEQN